MMWKVLARHSEDFSVSIFIQLWPLIQSKNRFYALFNYFRPTLLPILVGLSLDLLMSSVWYNEFVGGP